MKTGYKISLNADKFGGYLIVYLLLLFKTGWYFHENLTGATSLFLLLFGVILLVFRRKKAKFECAAPCLIIFFFQIITWAFGGVPEMQYIYSYVIDFVIAIIIVSILSKQIFLFLLCDLTLIICIASIFAWILNMVTPSILNIFPAIMPGSGTKYAFLTTIPFYWGSTSVFEPARIQGIFWEPGVFQIFINLSLIINYYRSYTNKKEKLTRLIILLVSLFLTYSTTGWFCGAIIMVLYFSGFRKLSSIMIPMYLGALVFGYIYLSSVADNYLYYTMYSKVEDVTNYQYGDNNTSSVRMESIIYPMRHIIENPLLGLSLQERALFTSRLGHSMFTCTPMNYFSNFGVLCGFFCFFFFFKFVSSIGKSTKEVLIISIALILATSTEQLAFNAVLTVVMLYGFLEYKHKQYGKFEKYART